MSEDKSHDAGHPFVLDGSGFPVTDERPVTARPGVVASAAGDSVTLFDGDDVALVLNSTASQVWHLLAEAVTPAEVVQTMADAYGLPVAEVDADVRRTIDELMTRGLVVAA